MFFPSWSWFPYVYECLTKNVLYYEKSIALNICGKTFWSEIYYCEKKYPWSWLQTRWLHRKPLGLEAKRSTNGHIGVHRSQKSLKDFSFTQKTICCTNNSNDKSSLVIGFVFVTIFSNINISILSTGLHFFGSNKLNEA